MLAYRANRPKGPGEGAFRMIQFELEANICFPE
jgi:hypothetical protein